MKPSEQNTATNKTIRTEAELAEALKRKDSVICIDVDLGKKVIKIKTTGRLAWAVAIGAIGVALAAILLSPDPVTKVGLIAPTGVLLRFVEFLLLPVQ